MKKNLTNKIVSVLMLTFISFTIFAQSSKISGKVKSEGGNPIVGASVVIKGTNKGTTTDANGSFNLEVNQNNTLVFSSIGYLNKEVVIKGQTIVIISLVENNKGLDEVVVTGVFDKRSALTSSIAISTLNAKQIEKITPNSAAELLRAVPGTYVNSSLGEVRNTVYSRGVTTGNNDGRWGYDYVSMQEDGLPVTTSMFANYGPDFFLRADATLERLEAVRGGTASIVGANAPGGIFNYISKTGGDKFEGEVRAKYGLEGNLKNPYYRVDMNFGGPLSDNLTYNIGGFYRTSDGHTSPGYASNYGGQIKGNLLYKYDGGSLKFMAKYLNDHNLSVEALPTTDFVNPTYVQGFDNTSSVLIPSSMKQTVNVPTLGNVDFDPTKLWASNETKFGLNWEHNLGSGWKVNNNMSYSSKGVTGNSPIGTVTAFDMSSLVSYIILGTLNPPPGPPVQIIPGNYTFSLGGSPVMNVQSFSGFDYHVIKNTSAGSSFAPNSLLFTPLIYQNTKNSEFFDQFNFTKKTQKSTFNLGGFIGSSSLDYVRQSMGVVLSTFENHPQPLGITLTDPTGKVFQVTSPTNNLAKVGSDQGGLIVSSKQSQFAMFFGHSWQINSDLNFDWGLRYENLGIKGANTLYAGVNNFYKGGADNNPLTLYDNFANVLDQTYNYDKSLSFLSYSAALNYKISNNSAIYGRYSNGKKAPGFQIYTDVSTKFGEQNLDPKIQTIEQFEVGFKTRKDNLSLTITPFYSQLLNIPNSVTFTNDQTGLLYNPPALFNNTQTLGVEVDANLELTKNFSIKGAITLQSAKATLYKSWFHVDHAPTNTDILIDNSGNKAANTPDMMANVTPEYATDKFYANLTWSYMGARQANFANAFEMPGFSQINFATGYNLTPKVKISANVNNLLNSYGMMGWVAPGSFPFNLNLEGLQASDVAKNPKAFYETFSVPARALYLSLSYKF